jgi:quercetin dioxygenase-like cupin family protein
MGRKVRMFTTYADDSHPRRWHEWDEDALITSIRRGSPNLTSAWRPFDMLTGLEAPSPGAPQLTMFEADDLVVGVEHNGGQMPFYYRSLDHDEMFLQFTGESTIETELGEFQTKPGEMIYIPFGIAHRATGTPDSLRVTVAYHGKIDMGVDPAAPKTNTAWHVSRKSDASVNTSMISSKMGEQLPDGQVWEVMGHWKDETPYWVVRQEAEMANSAQPEEGTPISILRPFDYFEGTTGKGRARAPVIVSSSGLMIECYNTTGEQFGFHRNLHADELWFHFAGSSHNDTELGTCELPTGGMTFVPEGVGHRTTGSPDPRMLMVMYHPYPTRVTIDPSQHVRETKFETAIAERVEIKT